METTGSAADTTKRVAQTVKSEASNVAGEASTQVRSLAGRASGELRSQFDQRRTRAAGALRTTADELASLADKGEHSTLTSELTRRAGEQAHRIADYVERTEPRDMVDQVRGFARRRPGAFLLAAVLAGMVTGRLVKSVMNASDQSDSGYLDAEPRYVAEPRHAAEPGYVAEPGYLAEPSVAPATVTTRREDLP
jgi:hypothetical protein